MASDLRVKRNIGFYPPLHVVSFCKNKTIRDRALAALRLPSFLQHVPTVDTRGRPREVKWLEIFKNAVNLLSIGQPAVKNSVVEGNENEMGWLCQEANFLKHGVVGKPTRSNSGIGIFFLRPSAGKLGAGDLESVKSVVALTFHGRVIPDPSHLLMNGEAAVYQFEPAVPPKFLRERETRVFATIVNESTATLMYSVLTSHTEQNDFECQAPTVPAPNQAVGGELPRGHVTPLITRVLKECNQSGKLWTRPLGNVILRIDYFHLGDDKGLLESKKKPPSL
jgi:hypothetical protein